MKNYTQTAVNSSFGAIAGNFLVDSIRHMIVWLIVMFAVIICDLVFGVRKSLLLGEKVRVSKAFRDTMGKMITYFSFVVMAVMISLVTNNEGVAFWSILAVIFLEGLSIAGNILKPKGYDINIGVLLSLLMKKLFNIDKEYSEGIVEKKGKKDETDK